MTLWSAVTVRPQRLTDVTPRDRGVTGRQGESRGKASTESGEIGNEHAGITMGTKHVLVGKQILFTQKLQAPRHRLITAMSKSPKTRRIVQKRVTWRYSLQQCCQSPTNLHPEIVVRESSPSNITSHTYHNLFCTQIVKSTYYLSFFVASDNGDTNIVQKGFVNNG